MKIEAKEKARARGVPSPDRAEALMLALCKPPQRIEYYSVRDLPRLRGEAGDRHYHPEDYPSWRGRFEALAPGSLARQFRRKLRLLVSPAPVACHPLMPVRFDPPFVGRMHLRRNKKFD